METKLVHVKIIDGTQNEFRALGQALNMLKEKLSNMEFVVTNDKIEFSSVRTLIDELYTLYKREKALKEAKAKRRKTK